MLNVPTAEDDRENESAGNRIERFPALALNLDDVSPV